jgi:hypothetical protein
MFKSTRWRQSSQVDCRSEARLNEAARTADATRARWSTLSLRPACVRDVEGVISLDDAPHLDAQNRVIIYLTNSRFRRTIDVWKPPIKDRKLFKKLSFTSLTQ